MVFPPSPSSLRFHNSINRVYSRNPLSSQSKAPAERAEWSQLRLETPISTRKSERGKRGVKTFLAFFLSTVAVLYGEQNLEVYGRTLQKYAWFDTTVGIEMIFLY